MIEEVIEAIRWLSIGSGWIPIIAFFFVLKKSLKHNYLIVALAAANGLFDLIIASQYSQKASNATLFNIQDCVQFIILCWFYYEVMFKKTAKTIFYIALIGYVCGLVLVSISLQSLNSYQNIVWALSGFILCIFALRYFHYLTIEPPLYDRNLNSLLFLNSGIFIYFSFSFLLFLIADHILTDLNPDMSKMVWGFHNVNNILKNALLGLGLYYTGKRKVELAEVESIQVHA